MKSTMLLSCKQDIVSTVNGLQNRSMQLEKLLTGQDLYTLQIAHMISDVTGRVTFMHKQSICTQCA